MINNNDRVKVSFPFNDIIENMYAIPMKNGYFLLDNSPFYIFGISAGDMFSSKKDGGGLLFDKVVFRGGHSTYRIKLPIGADHDFFMNHWEFLAKLGCSFEGSSQNSQRLYSIDMPPEVDVNTAYQYLEEKEAAGVWVFEEAHYCGPIQNET